MTDERYTVQDVERAYEAVKKIKEVVRTGEHISIQAPASFVTYKDEQQRLELLRNKLAEVRKIYETIEEPLREAFKDVKSKLNILENIVERFEKLKN